MELLFIIPDHTPQTSGNWVTAQRIARGLKNKLINVQVVEVSQAGQLINQVDLVHCFHVYKSGLMAKEILNRLNVPYVVSFTGTDLQQLLSGKRLDEAKNFLRGAKKVIVFHEEVRLEAVAIGLPDQLIQVINQSSNLLPSDSKQAVEMRKRWGISAQEVVFLLAGGIRPVKGVLEALMLMEPLVEKSPMARLILIGPMLDKQLGETLLDRLKQLPWASYHGELSHDSMGNAFRAADVVINTSLSEGMPNTLLEALTLGKPLLASNVSGNRAIVEHGINGYIFNDADEFLAYGLRLLEDIELGVKLQMGPAKQSFQLKWEQEVDAYELVYRQILHSYDRGED